MTVSAKILSSEDNYFLNVRASLLGKAWRLKAADERLSLALAQRHKLPEIVARLLAIRGVGHDQAERYLNPSLRNDMCDPLTLADMQKGASRIAEAIEKNEKIAVFGDYDVDGATSAALLVNFFRALGRDLRVYVPDRVKEGYGPNLAALKKLAGEGISLVITVDCGIAAHEVLAEISGSGLEVIVADHHKALPNLPQAQAVINPNRLDDESGQGALAAVGVTFLLVAAVNRVLREHGFYKGEVSEPDLLQWLDLVALGTVCDVVPLQGLNRAFVIQGLKVLNQRRNVGLSVLADVARISSQLDSYHLGFVLGPRINAGGRVGEADLGVRLLTETDPSRARVLAEQLDLHNRERQAIEAGVLEGAIAKADGQNAGAGANAPLTLLSQSGWHVGVIGIVASRLVERFGKPALVIGFNESGPEGKNIGKGSARSVPGIDIGQAVTAAVEAGLLLSGGGHAMAAGLSVEEARLDQLAAFLSERISAQAATRDNDSEATLMLDGALSTGGVVLDLSDMIERAGPFGAGNPAPRFVLPSVQIVFAKVVGADHVRVTLMGEDGMRLTGVAFRSATSALGEALLKPGRPRMHLAGRLKRNDFRGSAAVEFHIEDGALVML